MFDERARTNELLSVTHDILLVQDLDMLLERLLTEARRFTSADAGSIYLREGDSLTFSFTQNKTLQSRLPAGKKLLYSTFTVPINHGSISGYVASTGETLSIPDAYALPPTTPYRFDPRFDEASGYRTRSILTFPIKPSAGDVVGVLQLINATSLDGKPVPFSKEDEPLIMHFADNAALAIGRARMTRSIIMRMIRMAELRDPKETGNHVNRVASYSVELYEQWARKRGESEDIIQRSRDILRMAAMLHDVGKIAISDAILKKPARLDPDEIAVMQMHAIHGARLFTDQCSDFDEASLAVALNHHEKWNGTGYPGHIDPITGAPLPGYAGPEGKARGKRAEEIPPFGRVVAIADVYDALSSRRSYKEPWDEARVIETMKADAGTHFDPEMIETFLTSIDVLRSIGERYKEDSQKEDHH